MRIRLRLRRILATVAAGLAALLTTSAASAAALLVLEKGSDTLAIIDPASLKVIARVPSGADPHEVAASADGTRAYISNYGGEGSNFNIISVVDLTARRALPPIDLGALHSAHGLDFQGGKLYFTAETNKVIGRYDPVTARVDWVLGTGQDRTHMVIVSRDLEHIYTSNVSSGTISIIRGQMRTFGPPPGAPPPPGASGPRAPPGPPRQVWEVTNVPSGRGSEGFDLSPDGRQIWAANAQDGTITVIDVAGMKAVETFPVPVQNANRLKFSLDGRYVLVSALGAFGPAPRAEGTNLIVLDAASHRVTKSFALGGGAAGILMDPSGNRAFVAVTQGGKVAVVDLHTLQVNGQIATNQPDGMAWAQ
ncbi:MAG TPA: YncE family protein [Steroidobacteraceae bacterium]|nr:YncE family protein [Steroidobacteraceae bacterium]